uniref:Gustatory receptor n=1 Tax=Tetranychus urticae TaxID=32264 RepID=T1KAR5_TETUR
MNRFIRGYRCCYSKTKKIKKIRFDFSIKSISKVSNLNVTKSDLLRAIDDLEHFVRSTRTLDRSKSCKYFQLQSLIILILSLFKAIQFLVLSLTDNEATILYLGDFFVSTSVRKELNYIIHFGIIMPCMVKIFLLHLNRLNRKSILNILDEYKESLQEPNKEFVFLSHNKQLFRNIYYSCIKMYKYTSIGVICVFLAFHSTSITYNYSSLKLLFFQLINLLTEAILYYLIFASALWLFIIAMLLGSLTSLSISELTTECNRLNSVGKYTWTIATTFYFKLNLLSNWIDCFNAQVAWIFLAIYIYAAFHNILIFFYLTQFTFDDLGVKLLLVFSNLLVIIIIYGTVLYASVIGQKAGVLHRSIFQLKADTGKSFNLKVALKKLQALERMAAHKMGAYIGNYIYLDNNNTLILTLECGSLYLLFCTNINRNNQ